MKGWHIQTKNKDVVINDDTVVYVNPISDDGEIMLGYTEITTLNEASKKHGIKIYKENALREFCERNGGKNEK